MNHKLHNTILASAVVGAALLFGLLAAQPVGSVPASDRSAHHHPMGPFPGSLIVGELRHDLARDIDARARALEAELAGAGSAGEALVLASALLATSMVEATLASVLEEIANQPAPTRRAPAAGHDTAPDRGRRALATPFFSTAQGLRRGGGE